MKKLNNHYYAYKLTDKSTNKFYFGSRACSVKLSPKDDIGVRYFSSGKFKEEFEKNPCFFQIEILGVFNVKNDAYEFLHNCIRNNYRDPLCINRTYDKVVTGESAPKPKTNTKRSKKKTVRGDQLKIARANAYEKQRQNFVQYCDLETRAIVYIIP